MGPEKRELDSRVIQDSYRERGGSEGEIGMKNWPLDGLRVE